MHEKNFVKRLMKLGLKKIIISFDSFISIIVFFSAYIVTDGTITYTIAREVLSLLIQISAALFSIILAGLAIVTSFTDKDFIHAWIKIGMFENIITIFQYNLFLPLIVIVYALILSFVAYSSLAMIILIAIFAYMLTSLVDLVNLISRYGLQRGDFIVQLKNEEISMLQEEISKLHSLIEKKDSPKSTQTKKSKKKEIE